MITNLDQAISEIERLRLENAELRRRLGLTAAETPAGYGDKNKMPELLLPQPLPTVTNDSPVQEKIGLFRSLFRGREDVYAVFWQNERTGKKGYSPACEDLWSLRKGQPRKYLPLTDQVVHDHLAGHKTIGIFPLLKDNTCWFLACDFDKDGWKLDATSFLDICRKYNVPVCLERSRSGNGGHIWIFFSSPVSSVSARQLGMRLLRETMDARADIDLGSYDRFFPNQDFVPRGGFGNLIAAPLQKKCRPLGHTEFLDPSTKDLLPYPDQWAFLGAVRRLDAAQLDALVESIPPVLIGPGKATAASPQVRAKYPAPALIRCNLGSSVSLEKSGIPPWMLSQLKHLASLHNPEFYLKEKLRLSLHRIPRFIKCYREDFSHIHLPRGTFEEVQELCKEAGSKLILTDTRLRGVSAPFEFQGKLTPQQEHAVSAVLTHDLGVLVAPPGAGKTVMGCYAVAKRGLPTLILAHRKPILEQWRKQLTILLGLPSAKIGQVGGGRKRQNGVVDLAMLQSLGRLENLGEFFSTYGFIVVDECHHVPAVTFESCLKEVSTRYILGLTATPYRRDGLQDIILMQCGPIRYKIEEPENALDLTLHTQQTEFAVQSAEGDIPIQEIFRSLVHNQERNVLIARDVMKALEKGCRCLILSHWKEHCQALADILARDGKTPFILSGGQGKKERNALLKAIQETPMEKDLIVVATGQYLGEGFDCPQLDTLFLAFPVAFKGKLIQYVGRILRGFDGKSSAQVFDYSDVHVPVLKKMHYQRLKTYKSLGFCMAFAQAGTNDQKTQEENVR